LIKETKPVKLLNQTKFGDKDVLYLWGERGNGKSFAVQWFLCKLMDGRSLDLMYTTMSKLIMSLYAMDFKEKLDYLDMLADKYDLLVIDEIDKISLTHFKEEAIFYLLDERINKMKKTVFVGNKSLKDLHDTLGDNIISRILSNAVVIENKGELLR
jgi:DNA replication protein DnaC